MAIYQEVFRQSGTNAAAITKNSSWIGMLRVRMSEFNNSKFGASNTLSITNSSAQDAVIRFGLNNEGGSPVHTLKANSSKNFTVDDGISFYGFDIQNTDATTDIAIGSIRYVMTKVIQKPERNGAQ